MDYCKCPGDKLKRSTPFGVLPRSPFIRLLSDLVRAYFQGGVPSTDYDVIMCMLADATTKSGLEPAYIDPEVFNIIPYYAHDKAIQKGTVT